MPRLQTLKPRVATLDTRRAGMAPPAENYGQGRGGRPWRRLAESIKARDNYTCRACGRVTAAGEVDHIVPRCRGGSDDPSNLQWLCAKPCHAEKSRREAAGRP